ncbi:MAG TPA: CaiB/BaiF CoA-transferase family protein [Frankiaceae bacterium]|nr:CaiB/BaiF CoA-transferase family protein [Frankiaceae bacterium]
MAALQADQLTTMSPKPLDGVRVVELGVVIAGPAAAAMLGDWGADVIKVEPHAGDPHRSNTVTAYFELDNRNKRSICLDLKAREGREILLRLLENADVFVTNFRPAALAGLGLDYASLSARFPRLVYAAVTGYGQAAPEKAGYDIGAFWSRAGVAMALTPEGDAPPVSRPGLGDHPTGLAMAAGIAAALFQRERTGAGSLVETSLLRTGLYVLGSDLIVEMDGARPVRGLRRALYNPLLACYQSQDGKWFWLLGLQGDRFWPGLTRALGRPDLLVDPRFSNHGELVRHRDELIPLLDEIFSAWSMENLAAAFAREDVWWDPIQDFHDVVADPMNAAAGAFPQIDGSSRRTVASPIDFGGELPGQASRAPETGEHTEQLLLDLGYEWDDIARLQQERVIP